MGYSLCMMADFKNGIISQIFSVCWSSFLRRITRNGPLYRVFIVFWSGFLHRITLND